MRYGPLVAGMLLAIGFSTSPFAQPERRTVWSGIFTEAQAARGGAVFRTHCEHCHGADLAGNEGPSLTGPRFTRNWTGLTLRELFHHIKVAMPEEAITSVSDADKLDALAYILQRNNFPAGRVELPSAPGDLATIAVEGKDGPEPPPTGATVATVGCLSRESNGAWVLLNAADPVRITLEAERDPDTHAGRAQRPLGTQSIKLIGVPQAELRPDSKVAVIGFMVREPASTGINVVEVEPLGPDCPR